MHLCLQISEWWFALQSQISNDPRKVNDLSFPQPFLIVWMEIALYNSEVKPKSL